MIEGLTYIGGHPKEELQSIGLVFEPNFFTAYFYSDPAGRKPVAYRTFKFPLDKVSAGLRDLRPLFSLSFNTEWTLVPLSIFNPEDAESYLRFNTRFAHGYADWERMLGLELAVVSRKDEEADRVIEDLFPGLRLRHGVGAFLEFCRVVQGDEKSTQCFLHQSENRFTLTVFDGMGLKLANTIEATHTEDVRYFVMYVLKTLNIQPPYSLFLSGQAVNNPDLTRALANHISVVQPVKPPTDVPKRTTDDAQSAAHWIGLYPDVCVL